MELEDSSTSTLNFDSNILIGHGGRLSYLKGYRDGSNEQRVQLLKEAIERIYNVEICREERKSFEPRRSY